MSSDLLGLNLALPVPANIHGSTPSSGWLATRVFVKDGVEEVKQHQGADFPVAIGTPVYAAADGTVIISQDKGFVTGKWIMIYHDNGFSSRYLHLSKRLVSDRTALGKPVRVKRGQLIAKSGETDSIGMPHLHFDVQAPASIKDKLSAIGRAQSVGGRLYGYNVPVEAFYRFNLSAMTRGQRSSFLSDAEWIPSIPLDNQVKAPDYRPYYIAGGVIGATALGIFLARR